MFDYHKCNLLLKTYFNKNGDRFPGVHVFVTNDAYYAETDTRIVICVWRLIFKHLGDGCLPYNLESELARLLVKNKCIASSKEVFTTKWYELRQTRLLFPKQFLTEPVKFGMSMFHVPKSSISFELLQGNADLVFVGKDSPVPNVVVRQFSQMYMVEPNTDSWLFVKSPQVGSDFWVDNIVSLIHSSCGYGGRDSIELFATMDDFRCSLEEISYSWEIGDDILSGSSIVSIPVFQVVDFSNIKSIKETTFLPTSLYVKSNVAYYDNIQIAYKEIT